MKFSYFFLAILFMGTLTQAHALECKGRVAYFQDAFSNKCMTCDPINFRNPGQTNCTFQNTDHCCDEDLCNETNPRFSNWVNGDCVIPE